MKMKRALAMLLAATMVVTAAPQMAYAAEQPTIQTAGETETAASQETSEASGADDAQTETKDAKSEEKATEPSDGKKSDSTEAEQQEKTSEDASAGKSTEKSDAEKKETEESATGKTSEKKVTEEPVTEKTSEKTETEEPAAGETATEETSEETITGKTSGETEEPATEEVTEELPAETETETESTEEVNKGEVIEDYTFLTDGQTLHHKDYSNKEYVFAPEKSGYYYLYGDSQTDCTFTLSTSKVIYYTEDENGEKQENTYRPYIGTDEDKKAGRVMWLNAEEKYFFYCTPRTYSDRTDIDIELTMKYVGELENVEAVQKPTQASYDYIDLSGMQVKLHFAEGDVIANTICNSYYYDNNSVSSTNILKELQWYYVAHKRDETINADLNVQTIDGETSYSIKDLEDGTHKIGLVIRKYAMTSDGYISQDKSVSFETEFEVQKSNIASLEVVDAAKEYTQYFDESLQSAKIRVTYNDGTDPETITTNSSAGVNQYLEYTVEDKSSGEMTTKKTSSIDTYLENGGNLGEATVWVTYRGAKTSYQITIKESPYEKIEIQPKKKIYYTDCGYTDPTGNYSGEWIEISDLSATLYWKDGTVKKYDSLASVPDFYQGRNTLGVKYTSESGTSYYQNIDEYISAGGSCGTNQVVFKWMGLEAAAEIEIAENPYDHIKVVTEPSKKKYVHNSSGSLNLSGLVFYAYKDEEETESNYDVYTYGSSEGAVAGWGSYFSYTLGGHNSVPYLELGTHTVTLHFMGKRATYDIEVVEKMADSLEIIQAPTKLTYYEGESSSVNFNGMEIAITDAEGKAHKYRYGITGSGEYEDWSQVYRDVEYSYSAVDWNKAGTYPVTVSYMGVSDTFEITVVESPVASIEILQEPDKTSYYRYESYRYQINLSGLQYRVHFTDGTAKDYKIEYSANNVSVDYKNQTYYGSTEWKRIDSSYRPTIGNNALTLTLLGKKAETGTIQVKEDPVKSITLVKYPDKTLYMQREWIVDMYGAEFEIAYTDGTTKHITVDQHTNDFTVDDDCQGVLQGRLSYSNNVNDRSFIFTYMNENCFADMQFDLASAGATAITNESKTEATLTKDSIYHVYSFTPETTGTYCFYTLGSVDTYGELYKGNDIIFGSSDRQHYRDYENNTNTDYGSYMQDGNCYIERELTAGTTYYYAVYTQSSDYFDNYGDAVFDVCLSSTDIKNMKVVSFEAKVRKDTWYDFESSNIYIDDGNYYNLYGTEIKLIYENGWAETYKIQDDSSATINGKTLSAVWKYTQEDEYGDLYVKDCDDNAIVFTYGEDTYEVPVTFHVESPVESIEILNDPLKIKGIYQYQISNNRYSLEGLKIAVHYKDGSEDSVLEWKYDEEEDEVITPYLNGYGVSTSLSRVWDEDYENITGCTLNVQYMGASASDNIEVLPDPVTGLKILSVPEKMSSLPYESYFNSIDLYGLKVEITFRDGTTQIVEVSEHGSTISIDNSFHERMEGSISRFIEDEEDDDTYVYMLCVSYLGFTQLVGKYAKKSFAEMDNVETLQVDESKDVTLDSTNCYQVFAVTVPETGDYTFESTSEGYLDNYVELYNVSGDELASDDEGGINGNFKLTYELTAGKTYYLVARMYTVGNSGSFTCTLKKTADIPKENVTAVQFSLENPQAGMEFPEYEDVSGEGYYTQNYEWLGDADGDGCADYAAAHRIRMVLKPYSGYCFTSRTQVTVNGKKITEKSLGADGRLTIYYTFPYTACKVTVPSMEGYETDLSQNADPGSVNYGETYKFRFIKEDGNTDDAKLIVKANDKVLTADEDGYYSIDKVKENITVFVKTENVTVDSAVESKLTLHNKSEAVYDILTGKKNHTIAENENGENSLPVLESYVDGSDQFFYGWYEKKNEDLNGTGARFTSNSLLKDPQYELYAKWASGLFTNVLNGKEIHYKILQIDENNKTKVQVGDGSNKTINKASAFSRFVAYATGTSDTLVIPETLSVKGTELDALGIDLGECQVVAIAENAFAGETGISSVTLPGTIESIGANAFDGCSNLQKIDIPEGVSNIGAKAFTGCEKLEAVSIPSTVKTVSEGAFSGCESLKDVTVAEGVTSIGADAFSGCTSLSKVVLPDTLETVEDGAFTSDSKELTIVCSSEMAGTDVVNTIQKATNATVQTVDLSVNYDYDEKEFTYGDAAQTFTAGVTVDGTADAGRPLEWTYTDTDAYKFDVAGNSITVTPVRVTTADEKVQITVTDTQSKKSRTITLVTKPVNLAAVDSDGDALFGIELTGAAEYIYTGTPICPEVVVKQKYTGTIVDKSNYEVSYDNNTDVGRAYISVTGTGNYIGTLETSFVITKKEQTITAADITKQFGDAAFAISAKAEGDAVLSYTSSNTGVATVDQSSGTVTIKGAGTAVITITAAETGSYKAAEKQITLTVGKGIQTVTAQSVAKKMGDAAFRLQAVTNGDGVLSYSSNNESVVTVDGSGTVTIRGAGTAEITVKASETANYKAAEAKATVTVENAGADTVDKSDETKTPGTADKADVQLSAAKTSYSKVMGDKAFNIGATAKSSITYKSSNKKVATVDGTGKVTIKGCGKAVITVSAGDANYNAASMNVTIKVVPKKAKIKSLSSKKAGQLTVSWSKQKEAKGYIVEYSTDKKFKKNVKKVTVKKNGTTNTTLKKLKKGKKYYVRVKAYTVIDKKNTCGKVSKVLNKAVKK